MAIKFREDTEPLFSHLNDIRTDVNAKTEDHCPPLKLVKEEDHHWHTLKKDFPDLDPEVVEVIAPTNDYELPRTQSRYYTEMATDFASRTEEHILDALSSPGTLEKFANPEPSTDASTDPDQHVFPTDGDPLDAPSFPTPDSANSEPNMDVSNDLTQQSGDNNIPGDKDTVQTPFIKSEPLDDEINLRPVKRRRYFMAAVEVPTLASIRNRLQNAVPTVPGGEYDERIGKFKNPKVKRKEDFVLDGDTVRARMSGIRKDPYPVPLERAIQHVDVTRLFLSTIYGGSAQETFPRIAKEKLAVHGLNDFMYPNLDLNPYAPELPGASGLFFAPSDQATRKWEQHVQRVITRLKAGAWLYVGQYRIVPVASLTKDEWASQKDKVRNAWVREICVRNWGKDTLARIYLRKALGCDFTDDELAEEYNSKRKYDIDPEDIDRAFLRGEETIAVWTMKCIGYDVDFQLKLAEEFPTFVPPPPNKKQKKATGATKAGKRKESKPKAREKRTREKRKRIDIESEDEDEDIGTPEEEDPDSEVGELVYEPRGTRSRPIVLL